MRTESGGGKVIPQTAIANIAHRLPFCEKGEGWYDVMFKPIPLATRYGGFRINTDGSAYDALVSLIELARRVHNVAFPANRVAFNSYTAIGLREKIAEAVAIWLNLDRAVIFSSMTKAEVGILIGGRVIKLGWRCGKLIFYENSPYGSKICYRLEDLKCIAKSA